MIKRLFGKTADGKDVYSYVLYNGKIALTLLSLGATVQSVKYDGRDIVLGYDTVAEYEKNDGYLGAVIGRYANRISGASFKIGKKKYNLSANEGQNSLHGGNFGFDKVLWQEDESSENSITLKYFSPDGEEGYPSGLIVTVKYYIDDCVFGVRYTAVSNGDTPVNLTNHTYFNLYEEGTIGEQFLTLYADKYTPVGKSMLPIGSVLPVKGTPMDFTLVKRIGRDIDSDDEQMVIGDGYDHNFIINGNGFRKFVEVSSPKAGIKMTGYTDNDCVQFYTGNKLTTRKGKKDNLIARRGGYCFETQGYPNAVNQPNFPSPILKKGEVYRTVTEFRLEKY